MAATLPYGHQRLLEVAIGLAFRPKLLILDDRPRGSRRRDRHFCDLVRDIAERYIILIEHNVPVVMEIAHRVTVMTNGTILAEGFRPEISRPARSEGLSGTLR